MQFGVGLGQRQHGRIAGCDRLDLGVAQLLAANVLGRRAGLSPVMTWEINRALVSQGLPHVRNRISRGHVAVDRHFLVLVALAVISCVPE